MNTAPIASTSTSISTSTSTSTSSEFSSEARLQRWRLVLGSPADASCTSLSSGHIQEMDKALTALYDPDEKNGLNRRSGGGRGKSQPYIAKWLGDIRQYFPSHVVQVMQKDALERLNLQELLLQPELLSQIQPDVHMVANLISLSNVIPEKTKATARQVVRQVVNELLKKLDEPMRSAITGALDRSQRNRRPRHNEIDWHRTILRNLRHYQSDYKTVIPEQLYGFGRKSKKPQRQIVLCIDQSGSMAESVVYSGIFGAVMASLPTVSTQLVVFDTQVVDMTQQLEDPVDVLFGIQLGGGTDINGAIGYCESIIREPKNTILVLISDLYEGGVEAGLLKKAQRLLESGVQFIILLALSDEGAPFYDKELAAKLASLGVPSFACTPDAFPDLMAAAIRKEDINLFASKKGLVATRGR